MSDNFNEKISKEEIKKLTTIRELLKIKGIDLE